MLRTLSRCTAKPSLCSSQTISQLSPPVSVICLPICCGLSVHTCCLYYNGLTPEVSPKRPSFCSSASSAACSTYTVELQMLVSAQVTVQVSSQHKFLLFENRNTEIPSGLLSSDLSTGVLPASLSTGLLPSPLSFRAACLGCRNKVNLQENP